MSAGAFLIGRGPNGADKPVGVTASGEIKIDQFSASPLRAPATTSIASNASSVPILAANTARKGVSISNISTSKLYLSFSNPATVANCFIEMQAGEFRLFDQQLIFGNTIYGIWASANGAAQVTEYV
jgi:hypothetical protein